MIRLFHAALAAPVGRALFLLLRRYSCHAVGHRGAALAYYLLFSLFPLLILVSCLIGPYAPEAGPLLRAAAPLLPEEVLSLAESYLRHVSENSGRSMLLFSVVFSVYFPMRATGCLMGAVRRAYGLTLPESRFRAACKVFLYTVALLFSLGATVLVSTLGHLPLPESWGRVWAVGRFFLLGLLIFAALSLLYFLSQDGERRAVIPGAAAATVGWIALSALYSFYTQFISNYSLIYGALGTVTVVLIWLYLTAITAILGAELNAVLPRLYHHKET